MTVSGLKHFATLPRHAGSVLGICAIGGDLVCATEHSVLSISPDGNVSEIRTHADNRGAIRVLDTSTSGDRDLLRANRGDALNA